MERSSAELNVTLLNSSGSDDDYYSGEFHSPMGGIREVNAFKNHT